MDIIPVVDIRRGIAVQAVAGNRNNYLPLRSLWSDSLNPASILTAMMPHFRFPRCYLADLDGIEHHTPNRCLIAEVIRTGIPLVLDCGLTTVDEAQDFLDLGVAQVVLSTESLGSPELVAPFVRSLPPERLVFSLDLKNGQLLSAAADSGSHDALQTANCVLSEGIQSLIVLDLGAVGTGQGVPTLPLCRELRQRWPSVQLITGGGVHSAACLQTARIAGIDGLLIASALHDGRISPDTAGLA